MEVGLGGGEPEGAEPGALGAEGEAGGDLLAAADAAGGEDREGATASTISGTRTMVAMSPVWPPAS